MRCETAVGRVWSRLKSCMLVVCRCDNPGDDRRGEGKSGREVSPNGAVEDDMVSREVGGGLSAGGH